MEQEHLQDQEHQQCIQACADCHRACLETVAHCLQVGRKQADEDHVRLLLDCAQICQTCADFMIRQSDLHAILCEACAEVCQQCFESCDRFEGDAQLKQCATACRRCAELCQQFAM